MDTEIYFGLHEAGERLEWEKWSQTVERRWQFGRKLFETTGWLS